MDLPESIARVKRIVRSPWLWIAVAVVGVLLALQFLVPNGGYTEIETSKMVDDINSGEVKDLTFVDGGDQQIRATLDNGKKVMATWVDGQQVTLVDQVQKQVDDGKIEKYNVKNPKPSLLGPSWPTLLPFMMIVLLFLFLMNQVQGGGGRVMQFAKSKAKLISKDMPKTTFADVAGCEEAIEELGEIKEFLQEPAKFQAVGAKIPKGVLLYGQPGTGKTLLARAVAGEAGVPFYSISGSDFVEMFVGVGASRVRDLFEQAKENAPAIVFIDEIDAVGRHRGAGMGGGHDEREQTLNQLLVEMDGFDVRGGVILIAATNRPDILDPALLRPGRFDRQISVDAPDLNGREQILKVHARGKPMAPDVDLLSVARRTPGFTGADLANVLNEAALLTARQNDKLIDNEALDEAIDRVIAGPQKRTRLMSEKEKMITAYHEGGHALVAAALPGTDPVHKVTILPRGRALGYTMVLPDEDKYSQTRSEMLDKLAYMMGGRAAEEMVFHDPTTGAGNDIEKATALARAMVTQYGMTERLGAIKLGESTREPFLGRDMGHTRNYSEDVAAIVDEETKKLLATAHQEAFDILEENRDVLDSLVLALMEKETLDKARGRGGLRAAAPSPDASGVDRLARTASPSTIPPVEIPERSAPAAATARPSGRPGGRVVILPRPAPAATCTATRSRRRSRTPGHRAPPDERAIPIGRRSGSARRHGVRPRPRGGRRARAADRHRRGPRARGPARHPGPRCAGVRRADRGPAPEPRGRAHHHLRHRPRRDGAGPRHRAVVDVRAPPGAVHRRGPCRLHPDENGKITGLSKLARLVDVYAKRPQVQERLTTQVADAMMRLLEARGVIVVIEAEHLCMTMRGVRKAGARTITSAVRGHHAPAPPRAPRRWPLINARLAMTRRGVRGAPGVPALERPARHGHRQRHPRLLLRRRTLRHHRRRRSPTAWRCAPKAPTCSTSAGSPPVPARPARSSPRSSTASSR